MYTSIVVQLSLPWYLHCITFSEPQTCETETLGFKLAY